MNAKRVNHWLYAFAQPATFLGAIAVVVILSGAYFLEKEEYSRAFEDGVQRGSNLTHVFEENISRIFYGTDSQLLLLRQLHQRDPKNFDLADWINNARPNNDLALQFTIVGPDGTISSTSVAPNPPTINVGDRDYFRFILIRRQTNFISALHLTAAYQRKRQLC